MLAQLLENNRRWAEQVKADDPGFFERSAQQQTPKLLWIGCSDSRVPANQISGLQPGEMFVHRNIGGVVSSSDLNCLAVLQYAVTVLRVEHIVVCGHYGCGAVKAVLEDNVEGSIHEWLAPIRQAYRCNRHAVSGADALPHQWDRLCEINVREQVTNVCANETVRQAWRAGQQLMIDGLIYDLRDGLLKDLGIGIASDPQGPVQTQGV